MPTDSPFGIGALVLSVVAFVAGWVALSHAKHGPRLWPRQQYFAILGMVFSGFIIATFFLLEAFIAIGNSFP